MKRYLFLFLVISLSVSFSQNKYFIYFKDKGNIPPSLNKNSLYYKRAEGLLSSHAIERRKKVMNGDSIITFEDLPLDHDYIARLSALGINIINKLKWFNAVSAYLDEGQKAMLVHLGFIDKVEPVRILTFKGDHTLKAGMRKITDSDMLSYGHSYEQLQLSDVPVVQSKGITGSGVIIGLLDTGFDWKNHEALKNLHVLDEYDFVFHDSVTADQSNDEPGQDSHGTYVFSVIGGYKDSILIGAAYGASFILAKTEDIRSETHIEEDNYAAALEWMENLGVDVTSSSLGYNVFDPGTYSYTYSDMDGKTTIVTKAAELAFQRGVVTITAAGNEGNKAWYYIIAPADGFNTMAVGAVDSYNNIASFSSRGPTYDGRIKPDIVAMGVNVYGASTNGSDLYSYGSGTSAATPIAGGIAALLLSSYPYLTNEQVRSIFHETSDNSEYPDNVRGYGLISAAKAISFPNLELSGNNFLLHKAFIDSSSVADVQFHYSTDKVNFNETGMSSQDGYRFSVQVPVYASGQQVDFYFTYLDNSGNSHREPENKYYKFQYGDLFVSLNIALSPIDYVLSHNYPNPFNSYTNINFVADGNYPAELNIFDAIGRKVRTLYRGISDKGINRVTWNGRTDEGYEAASGIYIYTLTLNGKFYSNKMIYLK